MRKPILGCIGQWKDERQGLRWEGSIGIRRVKGQVGAYMNNSCVCAVYIVRNGEVCSQIGRKEVRAVHSNIFFDAPVDTSGGGLWRSSP